MFAARDVGSVEAVSRRSTRLTTPCGEGVMVWRRWGDGPPVVLLHGGYGSWTHWIRNVDAIARHYTVLAPDLPGMGESALPPEPYDGASLARIVADGIDRVIPTAARYHLAGFSFGGVLGGAIGMLHGDRVRSLTMVGAGGHGPVRRPVELRPWRNEPDSAARLAIHRENLASLMFAVPARIDELAIGIQADNAERGRIKSRPISQTSILADALPHVRAPVAAVFGERDATSHPDVRDRVRRLRDHCPDLEARIIAGAGHWVQFEAPDAFNTVLLSLLAGVASR